MTPLRKTYALSPRKLKKTSGVSCRASVSEFRGYCGIYVFTLEIPANSSHRENRTCNPGDMQPSLERRIVTLPYLSTRSNRVGDSVLYDYVPQGIIRVDSQVTSCQGTQVRLRSQMVEESLVLSQYRFELSEEEFIIKEDGEMEARISRVSLATSCQVTQGSCVSAEAVFLWNQPQQHCNFLPIHQA